MNANPTLSAAARRTGLAHNGAAMRAVCSAAQVDVIAGRVNLAAFAGDVVELELGEIVSLSSGRF